MLSVPPAAPLPPLHIDWFESQRQTYRGRETQQRPTTQPHTHAHGPGCFELVTKLARERSNTHTHTTYINRKSVCASLWRRQHVCSVTVSGTHTHTRCACARVVAFSIQQRTEWLSRTIRSRSLLSLTFDADHPARLNAQRRCRPPKPNSVHFSASCASVTNFRVRFSFSACLCVGVCLCLLD